MSEGVQCVPAGRLSLHPVRLCLLDVLASLVRLIVAVGNEMLSSFVTRGARKECLFRHKGTVEIEQSVQS